MEEQQACEHFQATHTRLPDGRYEVSLPRLGSAPVLGKSRDQAVRRYHSVERSLLRQGKWDDYQAAVEDFVIQGRAERVPPEDLVKPPHLTYYLPMHGVIKATSTTTKVHPVCDASARSSSGVSLNETLLTGPSLYPPIISIINAFRLPTIAMTVDVSKMYRQISLAHTEWDFHRFVHCGSGGDLQDYRMKRLTFGVKTSPYLASQVLRQITQDHHADHPVAADIVAKSFYMDDMLTGADIVGDAQHIQKDLNALLARGGMPLCKWRSNSSQLLDSIPAELRELSDLKIAAAPADCQKTLGLHWSTTSDCLFSATPKVDVGETITKRHLASTLARIFDLMGWFVPAIIPAKVLLQGTWKLEVGWDDPLPESFFQQWKEWVQVMPLITEHPVPRHVGLSGKIIQSRELHGFSDASIQAFGGIVYLRTFYTTLEVSVDIIIAKARVAPLKALTVPRLELCGAVVLARLLHLVASDLNIHDSAIYAWTDSAIRLPVHQGCAH